jgi:hypothetical protein
VQSHIELEVKGMYVQQQTKKYREKHTYLERSSKYPRKLRYRFRR